MASKVRKFPFPFKHELVQIVATSVGLAIFVSERWISPANSFLSNVIAGVVLYASARIVTYVILR